MITHVTFDPKNKSVTINGVLYTQDVLEKKIRTKTETQILTALKFCIAEDPGDEDIDNDEDDEMHRLVQSDKFKGDGHSMALVNNDKFVFWEQQA